MFIVFECISTRYHENKRMQIGDGFLKSDASKIKAVTHHCYQKGNDCHNQNQPGGKCSDTLVQCINLTAQLFHFLSQVSEASSEIQIRGVTDSREQDVFEDIRVFYVCYLAIFGVNLIPQA